MNKTLLNLALVGSIALAGCATPLSSTQKAELQSYRNKGLAVQEKDPETGIILGILPGGGSFYTRNYALGAINLLLWPLSVAWDPISGRDGAERINYEATKEVVDAKRDGELKDLEAKLATKQITTEKYMLQKQAIEDKYEPKI